MIGTLVTGVTALVFPLFASYRALVANDISLIRPWLMYWVIFATFQFTEVMFRPILGLVPFYGLARTFFVLWLVLPQTQGAVYLYQTHLEPWLCSHSQSIDATIESLLKMVHESPIGQLLKLLGISLPKPPSGGASAAADERNSLVDSLMASFRLPNSVDTNISAYLPAILGGGAATEGSSSEYYSIVRNRLMGVVKYLDKQADDASGSSTTATASTSHTRERETDDYDFVEVPYGTPSPGPSTEIEREVEHNNRRRWI